MPVRGALPWFRKGAWPLLVFVLLGRDVVAQDMIEWDGVRQLHLSDFRSPATAVGGGSQYSLQSAVGFDFLFSMSRGAFMFTKNFNEQVTCSFKPAASSLVAPDSSIARQLVGFARYQFDLNELYARKFRQRMYEEKGAFSDANFFRPAFDELQQQLTFRHTLAANSTDLGRNEAALQELHREVRDEIVRLKDFCRSCKPPRKRR